jgi:hypothetical protein
MPTLTEDDVREQGERQTLPPPVPMKELVADLMGRTQSISDLELRALDPADAANVTVKISDAYVADPALLKTAAQVCRMPLDQLSGFMLSLVDDSSTVQDFLALSSMPPARSIELLCDLRDLGLVEVRRR